MKSFTRVLLITCIGLPCIGIADDSPAPEGTVPITALIQQVAGRTGTQFVVDPRVRADVPLAGMQADRVDLDRLRAILRVHQFVAVQENGFVSVQPDAGARQFATRTFYDTNVDAPDDELVTVLLQAKRLCAPHAVPVLRPLMPQAAHLAAMPPDLLIINDRARNARRIADLFTRMDSVSTATRMCEWPEPAGKAREKSDRTG